MWIIKTKNFDSVGDSIIVKKKIIIIKNRKNIILGNMDAYVEHLKKKEERKGKNIKISFWIIIGRRQDQKQRHFFNES